MKKTFAVERLTVSAMMLAVATVIAWCCSLVPFLHLPFGGGFTVASMLPLVLVAYMYGTRWGLFTAGAYSVIQMLLGYSTVAGFFTPTSDSFTGIRNAILICLIDYVLAFTVLGFGGIFRNMKSRTAALAWGSVVALSLRYLCHIVSGAIFFGSWAEWFFGQDGVRELFGEWVLTHFSGGALTIVYSVVYNGLYMIPEIIITAIAACLIARLPQVRRRTA
mgnify:CR=1 FL=1